MKKIKQMIIENPLYKKVAIQGIYFIIALILVIQPWLSLLRVAGIFILLGCVFSISNNIRRARILEQMRSKPLAFFPEGTIYEGGAMGDGYYHFFNEIGVHMERCEREGNLLILEYSFAARKKETNQVQLVYTITAESEEGAAKVLAYYAIPPQE